MAGTRRLATGLRHRRGIERAPGQAMVEWAVAITVLLWICVAGVDLGRAFSVDIGLTNAARDGARYAVIVPTATDAQVKARVRAEQSSMEITDSMISINRSQPDRVTVTIAYPFAPFTPLVARLGDGTTITLTTWAAMPKMAS